MDIEITSSSGKGVERYELIIRCVYRSPETIFRSEGGLDSLFVIPL
jgi:hypothetical protein